MGSEDMAGRDHMPVDYPRKARDPFSATSDDYSTEAHRRLMQSY